jgi:nucleotide-binding universal stress UspA family protein
LLLTAMRFPERLMFNRILVPLDGSPLAEQALGRAIAIARASSAEIDITLVHQPFVFDGFADAPWIDQLENIERDYVSTINAEIRSGGLVRTTHAVLRGQPVDMICRRIEEMQADLVVMTTHARTGLNRAWLGSVADGIIRHATVPVLALRPVEGLSRQDASRRLFERVLIPVDGSTDSTEIFKAASSLGKCANARLTLLRVVEPIPLVSMEAGLPSGYMPALTDAPTTRRLAAEAKEQLTETARRLHEESGLTVEADVVVEPRIAPAILEFARKHDSDVVAMATHGRGVSRLLMGSVADKVMRGGNLPVLFYRPVRVQRDTRRATAAEMSAVTSA